MKLADRKEVQALFKSIADPNVSELTDIWECAHYHKQQFDYARTKFCSLCYQQDKVLAPYWWLKSYLVCTKHSVLMIDSCTHCNTKINEDSLVNERCITCNTSFESFDFKVIEPDPYSVHIGTTFLNFRGNTQDFVALLDANLCRRFIENNIGLFLLKELKNKTATIDNRRDFSLEELYFDQVKVQNIINAGGVKQFLYDVFIKRNNDGGRKGIPHVLMSVFDSIMSSEGALYKVQLIELLLSPPIPMESWALRVQWLEKLFVIPKSELGNFIKERYPEYKNKSQGPLTIKIKHVSFLTTEYSKNLIVQRD